jgi:hypothetical protein
VDLEGRVGESREEDARRHGSRETGRESEGGRIAESSTSLNTEKQRERRNKREL